MRAITIRFPDDLAAEAQTESKSSGESINQFVVDAVADALSKRHAQRALERMSKRVSGMRDSSRVAPASEPLIRDLRAGRGRSG